MAVTNTEPATAVLLATTVHALPHGLGRFSIRPHFNVLSTHLLMTADVRGLGRYGGRSTEREPGGTGEVVSTMVYCPIFYMDSEKTERYFAHKSRTAVCCSDVSVVLVNAFDKRPSSSDSTRRISDGGIRDSTDMLLVRGHYRYCRQVAKA